ncbi:hypothetical protein ACC696_35745 [Rhizobium ruizarguesonis]|uniref:Phasin family protein n=1 Tax=Rhizobium ruizarguesonis TaxID=2081791 RepID=A0ABY1X8G3_9HYPH|nr:hypothetical protein [Rhizobium ruizarguesonis]TAX81174.1 hypothetical protein ELH98_08900 [Rhizobium ruizarguesonis]TBE22909.1 hypothetical protein ELH08_08385 [Rhizobium ruizarguesonis]
MSERMSERAKGDIEAVLERLYQGFARFGQTRGHCERALLLNAESNGDYISPRIVQAFSEMGDAVRRLYLSAQNVMKEADRFFKPPL